MLNNMNDTSKKSTALDAFLNLLTLITLGWFSISFGRLLFVIIDKTLGDTSRNDFFYSGNQFSFPIASLLIITPVFLLVSGILHRYYKESKLEKGAIYRWLTYFMLLVAALVIAGDMITLVNNLLDGEYKIDTILKILTVLVISLGIFLYYWYDMHRTDYSKRSGLAQTAFTTVIVVTLAAIVGGFMVADSPFVARQKKQDQQRVADISALDSNIAEYYRESSTLPSDLSEKRFARYVVDPGTEESYEYAKKEDKKYELCATFALPAPRDGRSDYPYFAYDYAYSGGPGEWQFHEAGRQCYTREIKEGPEKDIRPVPVKPIKQ